MRLFGLNLADRPDIASGRIRLRLPEVSDFTLWAYERSLSAAFLQPWEPTWPADDLTRAAFRQRIRRCHREFFRGSGYGFFIFRLTDDALLGGITLGNVRYGVVRAASLGYWMSSRHAGQGYMTEAVDAVVRFAFSELGLHRIEAASMPVNARSIHILEKAGFEREGLARSYLRIDGAWRDHLLFARIVDGGA